MKILNAFDKLSEILTGFILFKSLLFHNVLEEFAFWDILHDKEKLFGSLDNFVKLNQVRVANLLKNVDLSGDSLNVSHINNLALLQDFYSHFLPCQWMDAKLYFSKGALT